MNHRGLCVDAGGELEATDGDSRPLVPGSKMVRGVDVGVATVQQCAAVCSDVQRCAAICSNV